MVKTKREKGTYIIQAVAHAVDILDILSTKDELGISEISNLLRVQKNNVFRILATLEVTGLVIQNPETNNYRLGVKTLELGQAFLKHNPLVIMAGSFIKDLWKNINETVSYAVLQNFYVHYLVTIKSNKPVSVQDRTAVSFRASESLAGRLLLNSVPEDVIDQFLSAIGEDKNLKNEILQYGKDEIAIDKGKIEEDVFTVCKGVVGPTGKIEGCIEVRAPLFRVNEKYLIEQTTLIAKEMQKQFSSKKSIRGLRAYVQVESSDDMLKSKSKF